MSWENSPHFFLQCLSLFGMSSAEDSERENDSCGRRAAGSSTSISSSAGCSHELDAHWNLWRRLRVAVPSAQWKVKSWGERKRKKSWIKCSYRFCFLRLRILPFFSDSAERLPGSWRLNAHMQSPPSLLTVGWIYRVVPLLGPHCWRLRAAVIVWRAPFVLHWASSSEISGVSPQFRAEGRAESSHNWVKKRPFLSDYSFLASCSLFLCALMQ